MPRVVPPAAEQQPAVELLLQQREDQQRVELQRLRRLRDWRELERRVVEIADRIPRVAASVRFGRDDADQRVQPAGVGSVTNSLGPLDEL